LKQNTWQRKMSVVDGHGLRGRPDPIQQAVLGNTESSFFNDNVETGSAEMTPAADALFAVSFRSAR
jgi:hypothetical protein